MDISDSGEFGRRLVTLAELFDVKLTGTRQALYFEALRDLPFQAVAQGLNQAAKACTFFPKPAELRKFAVGDAEDLAETAWMAFRQTMRIAGGYASVLMADAALAETVLSVFGSWPAACQAEFTPEMWAAKRKEFGRVYRVLRDRALVGARYLAGIHEQANAGRHSLKYVPVHALEGFLLRPLTLDEAEQARTQIAAQAHGFARLDAEIVRALPAIGQESA